MAALLSLTNRMPKRLFYRLCVAVMAVRYVPLVKNLVQAVNHFVQIVSFGKHRSIWRKVADTYDWHCCPYQTFHTTEELLRLFGELALHQVAITNPSYRGAANIMERKPSGSPRPGKSGEAR